MKPLIGKDTLILWGVALLAAIFLFLFNDATSYINISYLVTLYSAGLLVIAIGKKIPLRELTIFITAFQYLFAPALDYQILGKYTYFHMRVPQELYYGYMFPAFFAFAIALFIPLGRRLQAEAAILKRIKAFPAKNRQVGMVLVLLGLAFKYISDIFGSVQALSFIFTLLSLLRFIGILYIWLSDSKYARLIIGAVLLEFIASIFREAIFIQLIILLIFLYAYYSLLNKPSKTKIIFSGLAAGVVLFVLQSIKGDYRKTVWRMEPEADKISLLSNLFSKQYLNSDNGDKKNFLYTTAAVNLRLNQGWVMDIIMRNIPSKRPFFEGEVFWTEFSGLFLPRFIVLDKAVAQSSDKFQRFAGYKLKNYTISVGIFGDAYGNFGVSGGIVFCFFVGLFFNLSLFIFYRLSNNTPPLLLWSIFVFFYLIRAGDDFYIITNWIIKSSMMLLFIFRIFKKHLILPYKSVSDDMVKKPASIALN